MRAETTFDRRITKDDFAEMPILVPPPGEQVAIARYLDREDERIGMVLEARRRQSDLLGERLTSAIRSLILDAPGALRPVSALADYVNGRPFKPDDFTISGLPVVRIRQLVDPLAESDYFDGAVQQRHLLADGDLVFSWSASLESRIWNRGPAILNQHLFKVSPRPGVDRQWLRWALHVAREDFLELMHGSTMIHITQPMMKEVRVPLPSHAEQLRIAEIANRLSATAEGFLDTVSRQIAALQERRQALITAAVTGQFEIPGVAA
jgi:type I restriction enzyme S subunit